MTVILGLVSAVLFGAADFVGGLGAQRLHPVVITGAGAVVGGISLAVLLLFTGGAWSPAAVGLGAASGVAGAIAISLLYACLAIGPMSILAPIMAVVSALVPAAYALARGERLGLGGYVAIGVSLVAAVLLSAVRGERALRASGRALAMAATAGAMIGVFLIIIHSTPADSGFIPLIANRATNAALMSGALAVLLLVHRRRRVVFTSVEPAGAAWRAGLALAVTGGVIDAVANALTLVAMRTGQLTVVSVLIALSPAGTAILAAVVLRERVSPLQYLGIGLALAGGGLFALG
ncbi:DMT family transporter [soil metagenome]